MSVDEVSDVTTTTLTIESDSTIFSTVLCNFDYWSLIGLFCGVEMCYSTMCAVSKFHLTFLLNRGNDAIKSDTTSTTTLSSSASSSSSYRRRMDVDDDEDGYADYGPSEYYSTMRSTSVWIQRLFAQESSEMDFFKLKQRHFQFKNEYPMNIFMLAHLMDESIRLNQLSIQKIIKHRFKMVRYLYNSKRKDKTKTEDSSSSSSAATDVAEYFTKDNIMNDIWKFCFLDEVRLNKEKSEVMRKLGKSQREIRKLFNQFSMTKEIFLETVLKLRLETSLFNRVRRIINGLSTLDVVMSDLKIHIQSGDFVTLNDTVNIPIRTASKDCKKFEKLAKRLKLYITQMKKESQDLINLQSELAFLDEHISKLLYGRDEIAMRFQLEWLNLKS